MTIGITAVVLAGERPGGDALATSFGVAAKAMIPVSGVPMVARVVVALESHSDIARVVVVGGDVLASVWAGAELAGRTIAETVSVLVDRGQFPLLITTADHALLDAAMIESFIVGARGHDLAVGVVEQKVLLTAYPMSKRTWLRFRGGAYSGANLFWIGSAKVAPVLEIWAAIEQRRKRGRALLSAFGPIVLLGTALRLLTIQGALARIGKRFGLSAAAVVMPQAEACIDVDNVADHKLVEAILAARDVL
ncbi:4-diphosphocytidyl-2C-methyl-D-erythritol synthase [Sphingomonas paeninsulae]|uniref:4-diphosphocytidyl-2C-methyl-D-erythritol synthase n=1 Tax=Sphingomonas paeninsulae TaxID=2319844 RepID=A0A494TEY1_SPHPE|nr:NTP transferase domain-containing protein [Sphingomonas paeninsulae]AYJ88097.1 4-diphosphocytidyl-2C-methyl-D-erythritol synthase [Sphingomonas paeninsulae]